MSRVKAWKLKSVYYALALALFLLGIVNTAPAASVQASPIKTPMQSYVEAMQPGWNLGNTFDATGEEDSWGNPITTKALIEQIAAQGYKSIRIPITWTHRMGEAPDYTIKPEFMDRIQEVVDWSLDAGLYVMINVHHDSWLWISGMNDRHDEVRSKFDAIWTQVSDRFKHYPPELMFESVNEPQFTGGWGNSDPEAFALLEELNTSFYQIVRASGDLNATRPLVLPTLHTSGTQDKLDELSSTIASLNDDRIIATIHYYGFWPFSVNIAGVTTFNEETKNDIIQTFDGAYNTFVAKGIPVIIGEFGLLGFDRALGTVQHGEVLKFFEYMTYYAKQKGMTTMLWDNGQHFSRLQYQWSDPELYQIMAASANGRASTAQTDSIYVKKHAPISDASIPLQLNGNQFLHLKHGQTILAEGKDYTLDGEQLTIKAGLLQKLLTGQYGVNATLSAAFSYGPDWRLHLIYYDTPQLGNAEGTSSSFAIPARFNGDRLATMEAVYASGGNAGPQNWTPFKEYDYAFVPSYSTNEIKLTKEFFAEVNDGEVLLTLHFWSGNKLTYSFTKTQDTIIGVSASEPVAEGVPGRPVLSDNNGHDNGLKDGQYTVTMNMWHGSNGTAFKLYENGSLISTQALNDESPAAQIAAVDISGKANGTYTYTCELLNAKGKTECEPLIVVVDAASPGKAVLSSDNWDGDGNYSITMNMWWGTNAAEYRLYENDKLVDTQALQIAGGASQSAVTVISDKPSGSYTYRCELVNAAGATSSESITVVVE